jgi:tripartite-type tricarboxylate transporter receptor subunit TctC
MHAMVRGALLAFAVLFHLLAGGPRASAAEAFYAGKTITILVGAGPGGIYSVYSDVLGRHLTRHIPGNPKIITQYMPGGASRTAAAHLYHVAPKDGTVLAILYPNLPLFQLLSPQEARYDSSTFVWIGNMSESNYVVSLWYKAPAKTLEEAKKVQVVMGSTGKFGSMWNHPSAMNKLLGTKFKVIAGFPGTSEMDVAMERGEVDGRSGGLDSMKARHPEWLEDHKLNHLAQIGLRRDPELADVPLLTELATNDDDRSVFEFLSVEPTIGKALIGPPGVPADRVEILRKAFVDTMKDQAFLDDATKTGLEIQWANGADTEAAIMRLFKMPPRIIEKVRIAIGMKE